METLSNSVRDYGKRFSVIPLRSKGKEALGRWKKYQQEKATQGQIESWWKDSPRSNVGIVTGKVSGIIVIDCDSERACQSFVKVYPDSTNTLQAKTGKGKHFYFKWAPGIRNKAGTILGRGIDVRSDGGYVVAPPSIHENGKQYKWLNKNSIQPLPKTLKEVLTISGKKRPKSERRSSKQLIKEGERNSRLASIAGAMQRHGVSREAILAALDSENKIKCKTPLSTPELKGIVDSISQYPVAEEQLELTDAGNGRRFEAQHKDSVRYCRKWQKWLIWDGIRWVSDEKGAAIVKAKETARHIYEEASLAGDPDSRAKLSRHARASESARGINAMLFLAQSEPGIAVSPDDLDRDHFLLTVKNGTLNLTTGILEAHKREYLITRLAPVEYIPNAKCPRWERFLLHIMDNDKEMTDFLQRAIGWSLTGDVTEQKLFFFVGKGANGKSTFLKIVSEMLGEYAKQAAPELLLRKQGSTHPTEVADLQGSRFVVAAEIDEGKRFAEALLKRLTGGERIKSRLLYRDFFEFEPTFKLFLAANHKPNVSDDEAVFRRFCIVPFDVSIPEHKQDKNLLDKLRDEFSGILAWAVRGCMAWRKEGLKPPKKVMEATAAYKTEMDLLERFFDDCCTLKPDAKVKSSELLAMFRQWCSDNGEQLNLNGRELATRIKNRGFENKHTKKGNVWIGISVNDVEDIAA